MKEEKQIVLFFSRGTEINNTQLAAKLSSKFEILGDAIVIPFNPQNPRQPLIIFNQGKIKLNITITDVSFIYFAEDHKELFETVINMIEYFEDLDYSFERFGYISTHFHSKKEKDKFIEKMFKEDNKFESDFQLSWHTRELIDSVSVNVWAKNFTDLANHIDLVTIYDINTPMNEVYNITSEFLNDFLKQCDKYIENKQKKLK